MERGEERSIGREEMLGLEVLGFDSGLPPDLFGPPSPVQHVGTLPETAGQEKQGKPHEEEGGEMDLYG